MQIRQHTKNLPSACVPTFLLAVLGFCLGCGGVKGLDIRADGPSTISGTITSESSTALPNVVVTLYGAGNGATTTDASGKYSFVGLSNGNYAVTPSKTGYSFTPSTTSVTVSGSDVTGQNFIAVGTTATVTYSISGVVSGSAPDGVTVTLSGAASATTTTDASGNFSFSGLANGNYAVTPAIAGGYVFTPANKSVTVNGASLSAQNFTDSGAYAISGTVSGLVAPGVTVTLSGSASATTTTDSSGNYSFAGLPNGNYTVIPSLAGGYGFTPASLPVTVNGASLSAQNFTATLVCIWQQVYSHDLTSLPPGATATNGSMGGQGAHAAYGRTAWYVWSDWNLLTVPVTLAPTDSYFAAQVDFYLPAGSSTQEQRAGMFLFNDPNPGISFGSHGLLATVQNSGVGSSAFRWWVYPKITDTFNTTSTVSFTPTAWHTLRVEGDRQTCSFRAFVDGVEIDSWNGTCDTSGVKLSLYSRDNAVQPTAVAWSKLAIFKGSIAACVQPTTSSLSGTVSGAVQAGVSVILSGASTATTVTDASGNYSFGGLTNGNYTVTPSLAGYAFAPASRSVTVNGASLNAQNFTATCSWQQVYSYDLTSLPPGATATNGAMGGQGAQTAYGRTAWYVWSDWNLLTVPVTLAPTDSYFAAQVDFYLPAGSGAQEQRAGMFLFNDPNPGVSFGSHGLLATVQNSGVGSSAFRWWVYPQSTDTFNTTSTVSFTPTAWHTLRVEGDRQTCAFRALVDGVGIGAWNGTCDTTGVKLSLYSRDNAVQPTAVAWSNLKIFKVGAAACVE